MTVRLLSVGGSARSFSYPNRSFICPSSDGGILRGIGITSDAANDRGPLFPSISLTKHLRSGCDRRVLIESRTQSSQSPPNPSITKSISQLKPMANLIPSHWCPSEVSVQPSFPVAWETHPISHLLCLHELLLLGGEEAVLRLSLVRGMDVR